MTEECLPDPCHTPGTPEGTQPCPPTHPIFLAQLMAHQIQPLWRLERFDQTRISSKPTSVSDVFRRMKTGPLRAGPGIPAAKEEGAAHLRSPAARKSCIQSRTGQVRSNQENRHHTTGLSARGPRVLTMTSVNELDVERLGVKGLIKNRG